MIVAYLIFAHLLGDFIFQPTKLVLWKIKSKKGTFVHVLIHFLLTTLILAPYILNGYPGVIFVAFGLAFVHFWIDEAKINYDLKHDQKVLPFLVDQLMHILTIGVAYFLIQDITFSLPQTAFYYVYSDIRLVIFLSFIVFISTVVEIFHFEQKREQKKAKKLKINSDKMLSRVIIFSILYAIFLIISFYATEGSFL